MIQILIISLLAQLVNLIPEEWRGNAIVKAGKIASDYVAEEVAEFLDWIQKLLIESENEWDDYIIHLIDVIRGLLGVPGYDEPEHEGVLKAIPDDKLTRVEEIPEPFRKIRSGDGLYVIGGRQKTRFDGFIYMGSHEGNTYHLKKKT